MFLSCKQVTWVVTPALQCLLGTSQRTSAQPARVDARAAERGGMLGSNCKPCFGHLILVACLLLSPYEEVYILGWTAIKGSLDPAIVLPLYACGVFWTLVYDTIYAHQDKEDDLKVGVKSTALRFGDSKKEWITGFGVACLGSLALSGFNTEIGWPYYAFLAVALGQLGWQIWTVDLSSRADCKRKFVSNKWFGAIIFGGILAGRLSS